MGSCTVAAGLARLDSLAFKKVFMAKLDGFKRGRHHSTRHCTSHRWEGRKSHGAVNLNF